MSAKYRVFGATTVEPGPADLLEFLARLAPDMEGRYQGDEEGWFRLRVVCRDAEMVIERYLVSEAGIRTELNTWAAWVEATGEGEAATDLMRRLIATQQVLVLRDFPAEVAGPVCGYLARLTDGVYQADGGGFFGANGTLLLSERTT